MISPEIRELQVFIALQRTGSFSAAAKELGITQPAVSAHIARLEHLVGYTLFHRGPDGTVMTEQGMALIPFIQAVDREYADLLRRADYWKRSQSNAVKIWSDRSVISRELQRTHFSNLPDTSHEMWHHLEPATDWIAALKNFEVDIVIAGSFLKAADVSGIKSVPVATQAGITLAWHPEYYPFEEITFNFPGALASNLILPVESLAVGFREFLAKWCESAYDFQLLDFIECATEQEAIDACKLGFGVMILPGNAESRAKLSALGIKTATAFEFLLPKAFTFGIRYRSNEQNPHILATVEQLRHTLGKA
jgi:molybdate transport repressor ModE-like protein